MLVCQWCWFAFFRILLASQAARDLAGHTQAALAAKDPQKFADQVSELAGHADALADVLYEKIKGEVSANDIIPL